MIDPPKLLQSTHDLAGFDCGTTALDDWLKRRAISNQFSGASRTYVIAEENRVIGYYALATGSVAATEAPGKIKRNMPDPIPVMILGRFAIDRRYQARGLGQDLLRDAILRTVQAAHIAGIRALVAHAKHSRAAEFYVRCGFVISTTQPLTCFLPLPISDS